MSVSKNKKIQLLTSNLKHFVTESLKEDIEEYICIVKYEDGFCSILKTDASFEFKCVASKLLDVEIKNEIEQA